MSSSRGVQEYLSSIPIVTKFLLALNVSIHIVLFFTSFPVNDLAINPMVILGRGEYYRMVSSAFVHGGLMHIMMNMSTLLAIGSALENQYGTLPMMFLTLWCLLLCGATFVLMVWTYATCSGQPGELNTSAVGYSGILFSYALIEAFHSPETSRSVFGMFSVPTKTYPFILLGLIQVLMPNISFWGHLSGLLVGVLLISRIGVNLFMPSYECMVYLEQTVSCCRPLVQSGGYVPVREKEMVHPYLQCGNGGVNRDTSVCSYCTALQSGVRYVGSLLHHTIVFIWQIVAYILTTVGVPSGAFRRTEELCTRLLSMYSAAYEDCRGNCSRSWCCLSGAHSYSPLQATDDPQDDGETSGREELTPTAPPPPAPSVHYV